MDANGRRTQYERWQNQDSNIKRQGGAELRNLLSKAQERTRIEIERNKLDQQIQEKSNLLEKTIDYDEEQFEKEQINSRYYDANARRRYYKWQMQSIGKTLGAELRNLLSKTK